jgi:hypothetical protein
MLSRVARLFGIFGHRKAADASSSLDYEAMILLDAEDLAEQGIGKAYVDLAPSLRQYIEHPAELEELIDPNQCSYSVRCSGVEHLVYSPAVPGSERESWGRATYVFFLVVNSQLSRTMVRFYAINGGNELGGMFLTPEQAVSAQAALPRKSDWPYIPELVDPHWGQLH